jgi:hypothetical protein
VQGIARFYVEPAARLRDGFYTTKLARVAGQLGELVERVDEASPVRSLVELVDRDEVVRGGGGGGGHFHPLLKGFAKKG